MNVRRRLIPRGLVAAVALAGLLAVTAPAMAHGSPAALSWGVCANPDAAAAGWQCATFTVPKDYSHPSSGSLELAVTRLPAQDQEHRIGGLFVNPGGPGGSAVDFAQGDADLFAPFNDHFDIVAFDPRGTGASQDAIDCKVNQETQGLYSAPFTTPETLDVKALVAKDRAFVKRCVDLNRSILPYISTANAARDMDAIRAAMGDKKLNYLGFSYGTFLGATYTSLFPNNYRAVVLDGPIDANAYINNPQADLREQTAGFERALGRFFQACAAEQGFCQFGGEDPWAAYDALIAQADTLPIPAPTFSGDPRPVNGDDIINATIITLYAKQNWSLLANALSEAAAGDASTLRSLADASWGNNLDGTFDPGTDRYFAIGAVEQRYPTDVQTFLDAGDNSWGMFDHFWFNTGYTELNYGLWPIHAKDAFAGPFRASKSSPTVLEVATTYDPATPYRGAKRLAAQLGNVRFLTMVGDGHTAFGGNSQCIDDAVIAQVETLTLPAAGTVCQQAVPFAPPPTTAALAQSAAAGGTVAERLLRLQRPAFPH
jgi:pimeloyl-ACP methyl ester carboxylesterase